VVLYEAYDDLMELVVVQQELVPAAEAGAVDPGLLDRVREAEQQADLGYLAERVPAAFDRADDGVRRVASIVSAMREFAHPPTAERAPGDLGRDAAAR
jgi:hypothetical protein